MSRRSDYIQLVDRFIGGKIYNLRLARGMSRKQLASTLGITHQQVLKYEKGLNGISIGRLALIAKSLKQEIGYFYEGLDASDNTPPVTQHQRMCIELSRNFMKLEKPEHQTAVNTLVRILSK